MKKVYESPELEYIRVELTDVLTDSAIGEGGNQTGDPGNPGGGGFGDDGW